MAVDLNSIAGYHNVTKTEARELIMPFISMDGYYLLRPPQDAKGGEVIGTLCVTNKQKLMNYRLVRDLPSGRFYVHQTKQFCSVGELIMNYAREPLNPDHNTRLLHPVTVEQDEAYVALEPGFLDRDPIPQVSNHSSSQPQQQQQVEEEDITQLPGVHMNLVKTDVSRLMQAYINQEGSYLVRPSLSSHGLFTISVICQGSTLNFKINSDKMDGLLYVTPRRKYSSVRELIETHRNMPLKSKAKPGAKIYLTNPIPSSNNSLLSPVPNALPAPWVEFFDENYKRTYYHNPLTKQTVWDRPKGTPQPAPQPAEPRPRPHSVSTIPDPMTQRRGAPVSPRLGGRRDRPLPELPPKDSSPSRGTPPSLPHKEPSPGPAATMPRQFPRNDAPSLPNREPPSLPNREPPSLPNREPPSLPSREPSSQSRTRPLPNLPPRNDPRGGMPPLPAKDGPFPPLPTRDNMPSRHLPARGREMPPSLHARDMPPSFPAREREMPPLPAKDVPPLPVKEMPPLPAKNMPPLPPKDDRPMPFLPPKEPTNNFAPPSFRRHQIESNEPAGIPPLPSKGPPAPPPPPIIMSEAEPPPPPPAAGGGPPPPPPPPAIGVPPPPLPPTLSSQQPPRAKTMPSKSRPPPVESSSGRPFDASDLMKGKSLLKKRLESDLPPPPKSSGGMGDLLSSAIDQRLTSIRSAMVESDDEDCEEMDEWDDDD